MATIGKYLSDLDELNETPANDDELLIRDKSEPAEDESKRITVANLLAGATPSAHKDSHDPEDGTDPLDTAIPGSIAETANAKGSSHSLARADHNHQHVAALHQNGGGAEISVTGLGGLLVDDQHVLDAEVVSAVEAAGLTFIENKGVVLDSTLSADGKWSGIIEAGTAGEELEFGEVVYQAVGDGEWELAQAVDVAHSDGKIGICVEYASGAAQSTTILLFGKVRADAVFPALSVRRPVYISAATAGILTTTAPTGTTGFVVRIVGYANTVDELFFCPDNTYIELL